MSPRRTPVADGSDTMSPPNEAGATQKRKSDDGNGQPRAKRNRYISIACNECKRRKIKCNGQTPCQRCGNLNLECLYAPNCCNNFKESDEFKHMSAHLSSLQQQVDDLFHSLASLRTHVDVQSNGSIGTPFAHQDYPPMLPPPPSARSRTKSFSKHPRFHGPTANAFNLGVARSSLQTMGITGADDGEGDGDAEGAATNDPTPRTSPPYAHAFVAKRPLHANKDPIWSISKQEAMRLVHVWHEEQGIMYPILDMDKLLRYTEMLFSFVEAAARSGLMQGALPGADAIMDNQTSVLKLVLAITLVMEGGGKDALGEKLFENVQNVIERILSEPVSLQTISLLTLTVSEPPTLALPNTLTHVALPNILTHPGHVPLHPRRRGSRLAHDRPRSSTLSRAGSSPPRDVRHALPRPRRASLCNPHLLVRLRARPALESRNRHALCPARRRPRPQPPQTRTSSPRNPDFTDNTNTPRTSRHTPPPPTSTP